MKNYKILIVDDEEIVVQGIKKGLMNKNYEVDTVLGGKEAIKLCSKVSYDVVIVDLIMPGLNGVETCKGIKKVSPKTEVLLLSGFPNEIERYHHAFINVGGRDLFLRKPLMAHEIADAIQEIMVK
jgi:YesN/AraC family two-component response regulator